MDNLTLMKRINALKVELNKEIQELSPNSNYKKTNLQGQITALDKVLTLIIEES